MNIPLPPSLPFLEMNINNNNPLAITENDDAPPRASTEAARVSEPNNNSNNRDEGGANNSGTCIEKKRDEDDESMEEDPAAPATVFKICLNQHQSNLRHKMSVPELCRNFRFEVYCCFHFSRTLSLSLRPSWPFVVFQFCPIFPPFPLSLSLSVRLVVFHQFFLSNSSFFLFKLLFLQHAPLVAGYRSSEIGVSIVGHFNISLTFPSEFQYQLFKHTTDCFPPSYMPSLSFSFFSIITVFMFLTCRAAFAA